MTAGELSVFICSQRKARRVYTRHTVCKSGKAKPFYRVFIFARPRSFLYFCKAEFSVVTGQVSFNVTPYGEHPRNIFGRNML